MDMILAKIEEELEIGDHWERFPDGPAEHEEL
jgi:hypothetical protein